MVRRLSAVAACVSVMLAGSLAHAQSKSNFGDPGEFIFSADRLLPVLGWSHATLTQTNPPMGINKIVTTTNSSSLGFFWGGTPAINDSPGLPGFPTVPVANIYTVPRLGFDYTIIPNVTVGGDLIVFFTIGGNVSTESYNNAGGTTTTTNSAPTTTIFGVAPRGGYIFHINQILSIWARGGFSFYTLTEKQSTTVGTTTTTYSASYHQPAIDLDPQLVITPLPHFGFTAGLTGDLPFAGGHSYTTNTGGTTSTVSAASSLTFLGVTAGVLGWF
ncbi:MAG: hypothetical protein ABSE49_13225 [Polyangiaceae bacterium]|jgi:hypothetical protein